MMNNNGDADDDNEDDYNDDNQYEDVILTIAGTASLSCNRLVQ